MAKFRIKIVELSDSTKEYFPQYKFLFFWFSFETPQGPVNFKTLSDAKKFVDYQKKLKKKQNIRYIMIDHD